MMVMVVIVPVMIVRLLAFRPLDGLRLAPLERGGAHEGIGAEHQAAPYFLARLGVPRERGILDRLAQFEPPDLLSRARQGFIDVGDHRGNGAAEQKPVPRPDARPHSLGERTPRAGDFSKLTAAAKPHGFRMKLLPFLADPSATCAQEGFVPLFNARDPTGWDGDPRLWKVENGIVVGTCTGPADFQQNTFLIGRGAR